MSWLLTIDLLTLLIVLLMAASMAVVVVLWLSTRDRDDIRSDGTAGVPPTSR